MSRADPIRDNYFDAAERADRWNDWLFYAAAVLSIGAIFVDQQVHPEIFFAVQVLFGAASMGLFAIGTINRLYFVPRAEDKRREDFFGQAFGLPLTPEKTDGYYNNSLTEPLERMAAQVLENSLFTKRIALKMAQQARKVGGAYILVWIVCMLSQKADIGVLVAISQVVLSEQMLSKWLRLEWLRSRSERVFDEMYRLFQARPTEVMKFNAAALHLLGMYETGKVNAAILLDSKIFNQLNPELSSEWEQIQKGLNLTAPC